MTTGNIIGKSSSNLFLARKSDCKKLQPALDLAVSAALGRGWPNNETTEPISPVAVVYVAVTEKQKLENEIKDLCKKYGVDKVPENFKAFAYTVNDAPKINTDDGVAALREAIGGKNSSLLVFDGMRYFFEGNAYSMEATSKLKALREGLRITEAAVFDIDDISNEINARSKSYEESVDFVDFGKYGDEDACVWTIGRDEKSEGYYIKNITHNSGEYGAMISL